MIQKRGKVDLYTHTHTHTYTHTHTHTHTHNNKRTCRRFLRKFQEKVGKEKKKQLLTAPTAESVVNNRKKALPFPENSRKVL